MIGGEGSDEIPPELLWMNAAMEGSSWVGTRGIVRNDRGEPCCTLARLPPTLRRVGVARQTNSDHRLPLWPLEWEEATLKGRWEGWSEQYVEDC